MFRIVFREVFGRPDAACHGYHWFAGLQGHDAERLPSYSLHMLLYVWSMGVSVPAHVCVWVKSFFDCFPCWFFETGSLNRPETAQPCWLAMGFEDFPVLHLPPPRYWGCRNVPPHPDGFWGFSSAPHACVALYPLSCLPSLPAALIPG